MDPPPDFTDISSWYDMKLYTDGMRTNVNKGIRPQVYGDMMTRVFKMMNLPMKHAAHIGRTLGPKALEMLEFSQDELRILGNWDPKTQESMYSSKLPMAPIRAMLAGF
jgi:Centromere DNA-binding protein complex CBF3 subunit, domain 2